MCPFCKQLDGRICAVNETPSGKLACACGRHAWPNSAVYQESCRRLSLTQTGTVHTWTQGF